MAKVYIANLSFNNDNGEIIPYKRLCISGIINGETQTLQIKLSPTEELLAKMLLESEEEPLETVTRTASDDESDEFFKNIKKNGRSSDDDKINLDEDD